MDDKHTIQGTLYRCQSKSSYVSLEGVDFISSLLAGVSGISNGREYLIEASQPYAGKFALKCKSKIGFRLDESKVYAKAPELQKRLLHSCMDLENSSQASLPDFLLEKALLPSLYAVNGARPEIVVTPGRTISISISVRQSVNWEIRDEVIDEVYSNLNKEAQRLVLAFKQIEPPLTAPPA